MICWRSRTPDKSCRPNQPGLNRS